jgi:nicotinamidase-related amidase
MRRGVEVGRAELAHRASGAKLDPERATLVVIDVQEAFRKAVPVFDDVARATATLVEGAKAVGIPVVATEQYPKGLGRTVPEVADRLPEGAEPIEKVCFSAVEADGFDLGGADQAIVCGVETHVCVNQSVLDLLARGIDAHVVEDAVGSRSKQNWQLGLHKVERAGATLTSVETALFELVRGAGTDEFKRIQKLVLEYAP